MPQMSPLWWILISLLNFMSWYFTLTLFYFSSTY